MKLNAIGARFGARVDMTQGVIWRQLLRFSLPLLVGQLFQQLYNTVDIVVIGQIESQVELAAVGATGNIINALLGFFAGLGVGAGVVISQQFGARDERGMHETTHTAIAMTLLFAVVCTALGLLITRPALGWMNTPEDAVQGAADYLTIYFIGVTGMMVYNIGAGILRAIGDSRRPLYFLVFSSMLNLVLDLLFVIVFKWSIKGVALATVISQCVSAALILRVLSRLEGGCRLEFRKLRIRWDTLRRVLRVGMPAAFQNGLTSLSNIFVQTYINAFGTACLAGWTSYSRLDSFAWLPMLCVGMASTTFVGQNLGAGDAQRAKRGVRVSLLMSLSATACIIAPLMLFAEPLLKLINQDAEMLAYGVPFVLWMSPFYLPYSFTQIYSGALRGAGDSLKPMIITLSSFVAFRWLYLVIGSRVVNSPIFVGLSYPAGWVLSAVLLIIVYHRTDFQKRADALRAGAA